MSDESRLSANIPAALKKQAQIKALQEGITLTEAIVILLKTWVGAGPDPKLPKENKK
jgi:antitoxin component of RelBE/YafQ-DinJ toxin-antitoxin module